jgi:Tfp pilus assembly protein PilX
MKRKFRNKGSILVISVFVVMLVSALVIGILQINLSEVWLTQHRVNAAQARAVAEAGLNEAFARIRIDANGTTADFGGTVSAEEDFAGGQYSVDVNNDILTVTADTNEWEGYSATLEAQITVSSGSTPHIIRVDSLKANE